MLCRLFSYFHYFGTKTDEITFIDLEKKKCYGHRKTKEQLVLFWHGSKHHFQNIRQMEKTVQKPPGKWIVYNNIYSSVLFALFPLLWHIKGSEWRGLNLPLTKHKEKNGQKYIGLGCQGKDRRAAPDPPCAATEDPIPRPLIPFAPIRCSLVLHLLLC